MTQKIEVGSKWINNKGVMGEVILVHGVKRMAIKMNGKILKTLTIQKMKADGWTKLD